MLRDFRRVPLREQAIGAKNLVYLNEMCFALRFFARAAYARLAVTHHAARYVNPARVHQWSQPKNDGGCIATWIRDQPRLRQGVGVEFRQAVDRFGECFWTSGRKLVPIGKSLWFSKAKRAA